VLSNPFLCKLPPPGDLGGGHLLRDPDAVYIIEIIAVQWNFQAIPHIGLDIVLWQTIAAIFIQESKIVITIESTLFSCLAKPAHSFLEVLINTKTIKVLSSPVLAVLRHRRVHDSN
jgi:hypothetical protein